MAVSLLTGPMLCCTFQKLPRTISPKLLLDFTAPWAILATNQFLLFPTDEAENKDQLKTLEKTIYSQLEDESELLKREYRFSRYDRALAMVFFTSEALEAISGRCKSLSIEEGDCPTSKLFQFKNRINKIFGLPKHRQKEIEDDASNLAKSSYIFDLKKKVRKEKELRVLD